MISRAAWGLWPQAGIGLEDIRIADGRYAAISDGSRVRFMALYRVSVPDVSEDPKVDYSAALKNTLQQQRMLGLFEGLRRAGVPFIYTMLMSERESSDRETPILEFDLVIGTWVDAKKKDDAGPSLEQRAGILSATLSVALPTATVTRLLRRDLSDYLRSALLPGGRQLPQAATPPVLGALCTFDEMSPIAAGSTAAPEFYVPNATESGSDGILLGPVKSGGREYHEFRLQLEDLKRHVSVLGMSLDHGEPIVYRDKGEIHVEKIGNLVDAYFDGTQEGRRYPVGLECVAFDPATGSVDWSPIRYVLRHHHEGKMIRIRLQTGRTVTVTPNHSVFALMHGAIKRVDASRLRPGDYLVGPRAIPEPPKQPKSINLVELLKDEDGVFLYDVPTTVYERVAFPGRRSFKHLRYLPIRCAPLLTSEEIASVRIGYKSSRVRIKPTLVVDEDLARLLGVYTAEGSVAIKVKKHYTVILSFGPKDEALIADCQRILLEKFGISTGTKAHGLNSKRLQFGHRILARIFESLVGRGAKNKRVPTAIVNSPALVRRAFIMSWMAGDAGVSVSRDLINGIAYMLLFDKCLATVSHWRSRDKTVIEGREVNSLPAYHLRFPAAACNATDCPPFTRASKYEPLYPMAHIPNPLSQVCRGAMMKGRLSPKRLNEIRARVQKLESYTILGKSDAKNDGFYRAYSSKFLRRWGRRILARQELKLARKELDELETLAKSSFSFLKIEGVEEVSPSSGFVYDVSVPGKENFLAGFGGIFCHNTGSGKSTTAGNIVKQVAELGLPTLILDWHNEYGAAVYEMGGKVLAPGRDEFSLNPLEVGPGSDPVEHVAMVSDIFSDIYHFTHPQAYMFRNALQKRLGETPAEEVPTISSLVKTIEAYPLRSAYDNETKVALLRRLVPLTQGQSGKALGGSAPIRLEELLNATVCIELAHMKDTQSRGVFSDVLLKMIYEEKVKRKSSMDHLTVVEEARNIAPARKAEDPPSVGERMISELRKFGEAMMFVAQFPTHVAAEVVKNSGTKIVHRLAWPDDVSLIGDSLGLGQKQREYLTRLRVGEAVVGLGRISRPVLVQVRADLQTSEESRSLSFVPES